MPVLSRARSPQLRPSPSAYAPFVAIAATVLACFAVSTRLEAPPTVAALTIVNRTQWAAAVGVTNAGQRRRVPVGTVEQSTTRTFHDVLDHSGSWVLRFAYRGVVEEVTVDRSQLAAAGWKLQVPDTFGHAPRASWACPRHRLRDLPAPFRPPVLSESVSCTYGRRNEPHNERETGAATLDGDRRSMDAAPAPSDPAAPRGALEEETMHHPLVAGIPATSGEPAGPTAVTPPEEVRR